MANCIIRDDYIKRADVEKVLREEYANRPLNRDRFLVKDIFDKINRINSDDVRKNVRGEWLEREDPNGDPLYLCSNCNAEICSIDGMPTDYDIQYCPYCGSMNPVTRRDMGETPEWLNRKRYEDDEK